jgi:hypothetical protein
MLVHRYKTVYLSFISTDLPVWSVIEATASLYQKDRDRFHLLLDQQNLPHLTPEKSINPKKSSFNEDSLISCAHGLFWLELSPYRVMMTMQSNEKLSYRHFWESGVYGISRYCFNENGSQQSSSFRLRNYTRYLKLEGEPFPQRLHLEYELWSDKIQLGTYVLHLEIEG